jgi:hypothetical protein
MSAVFTRGEDAAVVEGFSGAQLGLLMGGLVGMLCQVTPAPQVRSVLRGLVENEGFWQSLHSDLATANAAVGHSFQHLPDEATEEA